MRAVAYRYIIRWLCGFLGWDNTRPLPTCIYNEIRTKFGTHRRQGYLTAAERGFKDKSTIQCYNELYA